MVAKITLSLTTTTVLAYKTANMMLGRDMESVSLSESNNVFVQRTYLPYM